MMRRKRALFTAIESLEIRRLLSSYVVNTTSDAADPGIGLLSLREAVAAANADTTPDTISFDPAVFTTGSLHTITLGNGPILFTNTTAAINLNGPGSAVVAVNGNQISRVFQISSGATVSISGVTVTHGVVNASTGITGTGGGILNAGSLSVTNVTVSDNAVLGGADGDGTIYVSAADGNGGGIYSSGSLSISSSVISGNSAIGGTNIYSDNGAAGNSSGGGIYCSGPLVITGSSISNNNASGGTVDQAYRNDFGTGMGGGITATGTLSISSTTIEDNQAIGENAMQDGYGGSAFGGGLNATSLEQINQTVFSSNEAVAGYGGSQEGNGGSAWGGAIYTTGSLTISAGTFNGNLSLGGDGASQDNSAGGAGYGGAIASKGSLIVEGSNFNANTAEGGTESFAYISAPTDQSAAGLGGAIYSSEVVALTSSTISGNSAVGAFGGRYGNSETGGYGRGGGVYSTDVTTVTDCTISGNNTDGGLGGENVYGEASGAGGFGEGGGFYNSGQLTITQSTIANNSSDGGMGGAARNDGGPGADGGDASGGGVYSSGTLTINISTISGNNANAGAGSLATEQNYPSGFSGSVVGAGIDAVSGNTTITNTIISANIANGSTEDDISGTLNSTSGYNLIGVDNPELSALANNGGPTQTMLPLAGSPVIDAGSNALIPAGVDTDQRGDGYPRILNGRVDIGAVESPGPVSVAPSIIVSPPADQMVVANKDTSFSLGTFAESNATGPFSATVDWGDGSTDTVVSYITASGTIPAQSHTFASIGNDTVTITVTDSAGDASSPESFAVTVNPAAVGTGPVTVAPGVSTTSLLSSTILSASGTQVRLISTVAGSGDVAPTGTVTFMQNGAVIGTAELSAGVAMLTTDVLATGSDGFVASYGGDGSYTGSSSSSVTVVIPNRSSISTAFVKSIVPSSNVAGQKLNAKLPLVLTNSAAAIKGVFTINYYVNPVDRIDGGQRLLVSVRKKISIKAGKSAVVTDVIKSLPSSLPEGRYYLLAEVVDPSGLMNLATTATAVTVAAAVVRLAATVGSVVPQTISARRSGSIELTITNNGNVAAIGQLVIEVKPSADGSSALPIELGAYEHQTTIAAGNRKVIKLRVKVPTTLEAGDYLPVVSITLAGEELMAIGSMNFAVE